MNNKVYNKENIPGARDVSRLEPPRLLPLLSLAGVGLCWLSWACVGFCGPFQVWFGSSTVCKISLVRVYKKMKTYLGLETCRVASPPCCCFTALAFVGLRWPSLAVNGRRWPAWLSWACMGLHWPSLACVGHCGGQRINKANRTVPGPIPIRGPSLVVVCIGLHWLSMAVVGLCGCCGLTWACVGHRGDPYRYLGHISVIKE